MKYNIKEIKKLIDKKEELELDTVEGTERKFLFGKAVIEYVEWWTDENNGFNSRSKIVEWKDVCDYFNNEASEIEKSKIGY